MRFEPRMRRQRVAAGANPQMDRTTGPHLSREGGGTMVHPFPAV